MISKSLRTYIDWIRHIIVVISKIAAPAHVSVHCFMFLVLGIVVALLEKINQFQNNTSFFQFKAFPNYRNLKLCEASFTPSLVDFHSL